MLGMKNHFDISDSIEIREVDIAGVACICKNVFGVQIPNTGPYLNQNRYNSRLSSLSSADTLVGCSIVDVVEYYTEVYTPDI